MDFLKNVYRSMWGPRLIQVFSMQSGASQHLYQPNAAERLGDNALRCTFVAYSVLYYCWPLLLPYLYRKGVFEVANVGPALKAARITGGVMLAMYAVRGLGRCMNEEYQQMIQALVRAEEQPASQERQRALLQYDITLAGVPVQFQAQRVSSSPPPASSMVYNALTSVVFPFSTAKSLLASVLARPMMYPGSTGILNSQIAPMLAQGRYHHVSKNKGERRFVGTIDGNTLDTMFFDRRMSDGRGRKLILASDGNAAFYEIGATVACLATDYSILGWNHPGFGASTGLPFPVQEQNAIEAVYQYATQELGFSPDDILLYAWSIGAYSTSFLAEAHPEVSGVILDATFDDIVPLAATRMPQVLGGFVEDTVRSYMNLNNAERINKYDGPLMLVRRSQDEMMMTDGTAKSNRGNFLFMSIMKRRYPNVMSPAAEEHMWSYLSRSDPRRRVQGQQALSSSDIQLMETMLRSYVDQHSIAYPCQIGDDMNDEDRTKMAEYIATQMLQHHRSTHCVPLPPEYMREPWTPRWTS